MNNRKLMIGLLTILSLTVSINGVAKTKKPDTSVKFNKQNKPYCNKGLTLYYSSPKDQYFCSKSKNSAKYVHIDKRGNPYCRKPYKLSYTNKSSKHFKSKPVCK